MSRVAVVGSLHMDVVVRAARLPALDETLMGSGWQARPGGKGGNQAAAAARMGASVGFLGAVGDDDWGRALRAGLRAAGVDDGAVAVDAARGSGMSVAIEDARGDYAAVVVSGANLGVDPERVAGWVRLQGEAVLLLQNEVPEVVNLAAAERFMGTVVLNAAPARPLGDALLKQVGVIVVNRVEAAMMTGREAPEEAVRSLLVQGIKVAVVTLGADGLLVMAFGDDGPARLPARRVQARSSHGAGDVFCGALAAALADRVEILHACALARDAAGLFVSLPEGERAAMTAERVRAAFAGA